MNPTGLDGKNDLTAFVISTGEATLNDCLAALRNQSCSFQVETISDVYPMSRAFQAMPERCSTRYFVQVDADMLLYPHAIQTLYDGIRASGVATYMIYGQLYEEGFGPGGAVKCWKRDLFRFFRFRDVRTVDRDLFRRTAWLGLRRRGVNTTLGFHRPRHSLFSKFLKYKSDVEKWRYLRRPASQYALPLLQKLLADYPDTCHRLLGALLGALTSEPRLGRSKDIRFEKELYGQTLQIFGRETTLEHASPMSPDSADALCRQFAESYVVRSGRPPVRDELAKLLLRLFSTIPFDAQRSQLLQELTSR